MVSKESTIESLTELQQAQKVFWNEEELLTDPFPALPGPAQSLSLSVSLLRISVALRFDILILFPVQGINHITTYYKHAFWFVLCGFDFCQLFELHANYHETGLLSSTA